MLKIFKYPRLLSTNTTAIELIEQGFTKDTIVIADQQTQGRGTQGRKWLSYHGNLHASYIFPVKDFALPSILSIKVAVSIGEAIKDCFPGCLYSYKYPNDILVNGGKVSGYLIEVFEDFYIIGIGVNLVSSPELCEYKTANFKSFKNIGFLQMAVTIFQTIQRFKKLPFSQARDLWHERACQINHFISLKDGRSGIFKGLDKYGNGLLK